MLPRDYSAMVEGYNNKQRKKAELLRLSVFASKGSWEGSISFDAWCSKFFPLWFDNIDENFVEPTLEQLELIKQRHKKAFENRKIKQGQKKKRK